MKTKQCEVSYKGYQLSIGIDTNTFEYVVSIINKKEVKNSFKHKDLQSAFLLASNYIETEIAGFNIISQNNYAYFLSGSMLDSGFGIICNVVNQYYKNPNPICQNIMSKYKHNKREYVDLVNQYIDTDKKIPPYKIKYCGKDIDAYHIIANIFCEVTQNNSNREIMLSGFETAMQDIINLSKDFGGRICLSKKSFSDFDSVAEILQELAEKNKIKFYIYEE